MLLLFIDQGVVLCAVLRECTIENRGELANGGHRNWKSMSYFVNKVLLEHRQHALFHVLSMPVFLLQW